LLPDIIREARCTGVDANPSDPPNIDRPDFGG